MATAWIHLLWGTASSWSWSNVFSYNFYLILILLPGQACIRTRCQSPGQWDWSFSLHGVLSTDTEEPQGCVWPSYTWLARVAYIWKEGEEKVWLFRMHSYNSQFWHSYTILVILLIRDQIVGRKNYLVYLYFMSTYKT